MNGWESGSRRRLIPAPAAATDGEEGVARKRRRAKSPRRREFARKRIELLGQPKGGGIPYK